MIIAIETSTPVCSVALGDNGYCKIEKRIEGRGVHSEYTFSFLEDLCDRYDLKTGNTECVLFSGGPGSYTGLRIGAGAVKGFVFQREIPLFVFPTLLSFAIPFVGSAPKDIHAVIDARREHLYHQRIMFENNGNLNVGEPGVKELSEIEDSLSEKSLLVGTGWDRLGAKSVVPENRFGTESISAKNLIDAWYNPQFKPWFKKEDPADFEPDYLTLSQINNNSSASQK